MADSKKTRSKLREKPYVGWRVIGVLLILALLFVRLSVWNTASSSNTQVSQKTFNDFIQSHNSALEHQFEVYADTLYSGRALFLSDNSVSRKDWSNFVSAQNILQRYPGLYGIAYVSVISSSQASQLEAQLNLNRYASETDKISIYPKSRDSTLAVMTYLAPDTAMQRLIGYDLYTSPVRAKAMNTARDSGTAEATIPLVLGSDNPNSAPASLLVLMPTYDASKPVTTIVERREAIKGFVILSLHTKPLLDSVFKNPYKNDVAVSVVANGQKIYSIGSQPKGTILSKQTSINVGGQRWQINYSAANTLGLGSSAKSLHYLLIYSAIPLLLFYFLLFYFSIRYLTLKRHHEEHHHNGLNSDHDAGHII